MNSNTIREKFVSFFNNNKHQLAAPSSLIPHETDASVLFTTAGMQQFKNYYAYPDRASTARMVTIQPCVRTSDIEEVGDKTHLTFFEMLGNFSFGYPGKKGSYFKKEAIDFAWEFLTDKKWLGIDPGRISATYFGGDEEKKLMIDEGSRRNLESVKGLDKIEPHGFEDNFWTLGTELSPAGPTIEFYVDPSTSLGAGGIEVWNLVFNEYVFHDNEYGPSRYQGVDTGMGLERLAAIMQEKDDVYETDLFWPIIKYLGDGEVLPLNYNRDKESLKIIVDHLKAATFLVNDGVFPSNKDQGYIVRRLIRRALLHSQWSEYKNDWVPEIIEEIINIYPSLQNSKDKINKVISLEIEKFQTTVERGKKIITKLEILDAKAVFDLYQTYGFPLELSREYAAMKKIKINNEDLNAEIKKHQELSRTASAGKFKGGLEDTSEQTIKLHTAAHLLLAALRQILGDRVIQKGSNINAERLRFDFSHPEKLTPEQVKKVENLVNEKIKSNLLVKMKQMSLEEAKKSGANGTFDARYGDKVKVYSIGTFSKEICGGPHVKKTSLLGKFKIIKEESSSAGVRRIKAVLNKT